MMDSLDKVLNVRFKNTYQASLLVTLHGKEIDSQGTKTARDAGIRAFDMVTISVKPNLIGGMMHSEEEERKKGEILGAANTVEEEESKTILTE